VLPASAPTAAFFTQVEQLWANLSAELRNDLEARAKATGALVRRRQVRSALDLLRLVLAYALFPWSLRMLGAWFCLLGLGRLSDVAILKRLRQSRLWLGTLLVQLLQPQVALTPQPEVRIQLVDATIIANPGRHKGRWYVHTSFDLGRMALTHLALTDQRSAESLAHFSSQPGEIRIADRGYAYARSLGAGLATGAWHIVRAHWQNLTLLDPAGQRLDVLAWLRSQADRSFTAPGECPVQVVTPAGTFALRLIAAALPPESLKRAQRRVRENAKHKGRRPTPASLEAAGFMLVLTNLPATWAARQVLELYRLRWQVELVFKRLKGLLRLADLRSDDPELAQTFLLGNLVAAVLLDRLSQDVRSAVPEWFTDLERPISFTRLTQVGLALLRQSVHGHISAARVWAELPNLQRYLCDSPRRRVPQCIAAQVFLSCLSTC
jgi:hypothetical protein